MNKGQLIEALVARFGITKKDAKSSVESFVDSMTETLIAGGRMEIRGFGTFRVREYRAYSGRNPKTGEPILADKKRLPLFKSGDDLKKRLNKRPLG